MQRLDDSNREEALKYVVDLYTKFLGEPDSKDAEPLRNVHLKQMKNFTHMFNREDEVYLVKEGLRIQANDMNELDKAFKLRANNTDLFKKGLRTKASDVITLDFPEMFKPKKAEEPKSKVYDEDEYKEDDDDELKSDSSTVSGGTSKELLSNEKILENIKKIKDIKDDIFYPTVESLILGNNIELGTSLQQKLAYLGFEGDGEFKISNTTNVDILINDILNSFISIDLYNSKNIENLKFVINKISVFKEWDEFIKVIK